jgi:hypothetical protein
MNRVLSPLVARLLVTEQYGEKGVEVTPRLVQDASGHFSLWGNNRGMSPVSFSEGDYP